MYRRFGCKRWERGPLWWFFPPLPVSIYASPKRARRCGRPASQVRSAFSEHTVESEVVSFGPPDCVYRMPNEDSKIIMLFEVFKALSGRKIWLPLIALRKKSAYCGRALQVRQLLLKSANLGVFRSKLRAASSVANHTASTLQAGLEANIFNSISLRLHGYEQNCQIKPTYIDRCL